MKTNKLYNFLISEEKKDQDPNMYEIDNLDVSISKNSIKKNTKNDIQIENELLRETMINNPEKMLTIKTNHQNVTKNLDKESFSSIEKTENTETIASLLNEMNKNDKFFKTISKLKNSINKITSEMRDKNHNKAPFSMKNKNNQYEEPLLPINVMKKNKLYLKKNNVKNKAPQNTIVENTIKKKYFHTKREIKAPDFPLQHTNEQIERVPKDILFKARRKNVLDANASKNPNQDSPGYDI